MLNHYIDYITGWYIVEHDVPADELTGYYNYVLKIQAKATKYQDLEPLRLGINYLRCHREIDVKDYGDSLYPWDNEEVREILDYICFVIWGENPKKVNCEEVKNVELIDMDRHDWWKMRGVRP